MKLPLKLELMPIFDLYLPQVIDEEDSCPIVEEKIEPEGGSGTILVVEDDPDTLNALAEFLTRDGYTVITAVDGQDAVEQFAARADEIRLVISDVVMPRKSGKEACTEIKMLSDNVKFLFVSGYSDRVIAREGGLEGDGPLIEKPVMPYVLLSEIRKLIG